MALQGFVESYYLQAKLEQLQNDPDFAAEWASKGVADVAAAFADAGLTAEQHYEEYGYKEGLAPNEFFNPAEYVLAKANQLIATDDSYSSVNDAAAAFVNAWNGNVYQHYLQYGDSEGVNPSNEFDVAGYLQEKLALLQSDSATAAEWADKGTDDVAAAFASAGLTTLGHFIAYGEDEGLSAPPVPEDDRVDVDGGEPDPDPGVVGETFELTDGRDVINGTENDDTFVGLVGQNQNGAVSNAFSTGDRLDGGEGRDKVIATMINDNETASGFNQSPRPITENIEEVHIEALETGNVSAGIFEEALPGLSGLFNNYVTLNAGSMNNVEEYWSSNSRGDLFINDVRLGDKQSITKDVTFGLRDADTSAGIYAAFETNSLRAAPPAESNSQLLVRVADVTAPDSSLPLSNVQLDIGFTAGGDEYVLENITSEDGTYSGLKTAIEEALDSRGLGDYDVALANPYNQVTVGGNTVFLPFTAQEVLITNPDGGAFTDVSFDYKSIESVSEEFLVAGNAQAVAPNIDSTVIETNAVLDNAGRGSTAGDVVIGGMSNSNQAIHTLNLEVDRSSKVNQVTSAVGMDPKEQGPANVGNYIDFNTIKVTSGEAQGDVSINNVGNVHNFDATDFAGDNLAVSGKAVLPDSHVYNTGGSNDTIHVDWSTDVAGESADYSLQVTTGGGDDSVHLVADTRIENDLLNQQDLKNVVVNTGEGNDFIWTEGAGAVHISAGAGRDVVYSDNSGDVAAWAFGFEAGSTPDVTNLRGNLPALDSGAVTPNGNSIPAVMYGAKLKVTFSGANVGGAVTSGSAAGQTNGFESVVDILDNGAVFGDRTDINNAVIEAINEHNVLGNLLEVTTGPENTLLITSKIDGTYVADDLLIEYFPQNVSNLSNNEKTLIEKAVQEEAQDSNYSFSNAVINNTATAVDGIEGIDGSVLAQDQFGTDIVGAASGADNTGNVINLGTGQDVAVLSTDANSNETIEITGYDNGHNTIVNFDSVEGSGTDLLDFTAYLTTEERLGGSGSTNSQNLVDIGVSSSGQLGANQVTTFDFAPAPNEGFGGLNAGVLVDALNGNITYGGVEGIGFDAQPGTLVGNTYNGIVMVQNSNNDGQYKIFDVSVGKSGGSEVATGAELVGVYDFGNELAGFSDASLVGA